MKILLRVVAALVVLLALAIAALVILLPPLLRSEAVRGRLETEARAATGREVAWEALDVGLLPPRMVVRGPRVGSDADEVRFAADDVALEIALAPLLAGVVLVDSVEVRGARARVVRTEEGLVHPFAPPGALAGVPGDEAAPAGPAAPEPADGPAVGGAAEEEGGGASFAVRDVVLRDAEITLIDRSVSPPVTWELRELGARARGELVARSLHFELDTELASGGRLAAEGSLRPGGSAEGELTLTGAVLAPLAPYLPDGSLALGTLDARVAFRRGGEGDVVPAASLLLEEGRVAGGGGEVRGRIAVEASDVRLAGPGGATLPGGPVAGALDVVVEGARIASGDTSVASPRLALRATGVGLEALSAASLDLALDAAEIASAGTRVRGEVALRATDAALDGPRAGGFELVLGDGAIEAEGASLRGRLEAEGRLGGPDGGTARIVLSQGSLESEGFVARGRLVVDASGLRPGDALGADLDVDAGGAELDAGDWLRKPADVPATLTGRLERSGANGEGWALRGGRVRLGEVAAGLDATSVPRPRATVRAERLALAELAAFVPRLAEAGVTGEVAIPELHVATAPLAATGRVDLVDVRVRRGEAPALSLRGAVEARGDEIRAPDLELRIADQPLRVDARLLGLSGRPRYDASVRGEGLDAQALLRAFDPDHDTLSGRLALRGRVAGPLAGEPPPAETVVGQVWFEIRPGRLKDVSLLAAAFDDLATGAAAAVLSRAGDMRRYEEDEFESLSATIDLGGGLARTRDLRLVYRHYTVDLHGSVGLASQALDLTGEMTIDPEIDAALSGHPDPASRAGRRKVIPLARVGGTLEAPRVTLGEDAIFRFASAYLRDERRRGNWEEEIDERLGEGSGKVLLDTLDSVLRGQPPP